MKKKMSLVSLIGVTLAFFATVRSVPSVAATGWEQIVYMLIAGIMFALPISLLSAEMSTIWTDSGGPQVWVSNALGEKWGFLVSWLLWVQMFFGMVMVSSTVSVMLGDILEIESLKTSHFAIFLVIVLVYWLVTFLNLKFDMVKIQGSYGAVLGVYLPFIIITILGLIFLFKHGISPQGYLADFTPAKMFPNFGDISALPIFVSIAFIFAGVEMSSVHVNEVENPGRNYPIAVILAVILVIALNLIAGIGVANAVPNGTIALSNVIQSVEIILKDFNLPIIIAQFMAVCVLIGVLTSLSSWVLGPSKAMQHVAEEGGLPTRFQKKNEKGDPVTLVILQACVVSVIACLYLIPGININVIFLMLTISTTLIYCVVYLMIVIAALKLRYKMPDAKRVFRLGASGNGLIWFVSVMALIVIISVIGISFIPPSSLPVADDAGYIIFQVCALAIAVGSGLFIYSRRKPEWRSEGQKSEGQKAE